MPAWPLCIPAAALSCFRSPCRCLVMLSTISLIPHPSLTPGHSPHSAHSWPGNAFMSELQSRLVPLLVEQEEFWARYFYRYGPVRVRAPAGQQGWQRAHILLV